MDKIINFKENPDLNPFDYVLGAMSVGQNDLSILIEDINDKKYHPKFDKGEVKKCTIFLQLIKEGNNRSNK
jgi:hypothetical protein